MDQQDAPLKVFFNYPNRQIPKVATVYVSYDKKDPTKS